MTNYDHHFYATRDQRTHVAAERLLAAAFTVMPVPHSAIDIGCAVGTWLRVLSDRGVDYVRGVDGPWVPMDLLKIPREHFVEFDLQRATPDVFNSLADRRFDLAICLEVAEHLDASKADALVRLLTRLSDVILFSAAIPGQGGRGHVNEQWPDYWWSRFRDQRYSALDVIRQQVWADDTIPWWYRQNALLFVAESRLPAIAPMARIEHVPLSLVHPELFRARVQGEPEYPSPGTALQFLGRTIRARMFRC